MTGKRTRYSADFKAKVALWSRSAGRGFYHRPVGETALNLELMRLIDAHFLEIPLVRLVADDAAFAARRRCGRPQAHSAADGEDGPDTDLPTATNDGADPEHRIFPYLLRDLGIDRANQFRRANITDLPMRRGFLYLAGRGAGLGDAEGTAWRVRTRWR